MVIETEVGLDNNEKQRSIFHISRTLLINNIWWLDWSCMWGV